MRWRSRRIVAFDTETTGLNPHLEDRIVEFAAVVFELDDRGDIVHEGHHSWLVNPGIPIPKASTQITGISDADVVNAPPFQEIAPMVRELFVDAVSVAHNYPFDLAFLKKELKLSSLEWVEPLAAVDTVDVSMRWFRDARSHKLEDLCKRLGIVLEGAHRATNDALACGRCFIELTRRHQVEDELQSMLDWAKAIGRPPEDGPLGTDPNGAVVFSEDLRVGGQELFGKPVEEHPLALAWMEMARERRLDGWGWRFPESTRRWIRRWLDVRGQGRAAGGGKSFRAEDWAPDSCIVERRIRA
jgi:DNA polymerase III epsilon subunit family exonuclease